MKADEPSTLGVRMAYELAFTGIQAEAVVMVGQLETLVANLGEFVPGEVDLHELTRLAALLRTASDALRTLAVL